MNNEDIIKIAMNQSKNDMNCKLIDLQNSKKTVVEFKVSLDSKKVFYS